MNWPFDGCRGVRAKTIAGGFADRAVPLALALGIALAVGGAVCSGEERGSAREGPTPAVSVNDADRPADETVIRERTIYVPYERFRAVFEKDGRGVFLPYEKFRELWQAAQATVHPQPQPVAPVSFLFRAAANELELGKDAVLGTTELDLVVLNKGWHLIPLRLSDVAVRQATLDGEAADLVFENGYFLLLHHEDSEPRQMHLSLEFAKGISRQGGERTVSIEVPPVAASRWRVHTPEPGVRIEITPAATPPSEGATPAAGRDRAEAQSDDEGELARSGSEATAYAAPSPTVTIRWTPTAEGATGMEALASVQTRVEVFMDRVQTRIQSQLEYSVSRAEWTTLKIRLPKDCSVQGVFDPNVRRWKRSFPEDSPDSQQIDVELFEPVRNTQRLSMVYFVPTQSGKATSLPVIQPMGVGQHQGYVAVRLGEGLRGEVVSSRGLMQTDPSELQENARQQGWDWVFRYISVPYELALLVDPVAPRVTVDETVVLDVAERDLQLSAVGIFTIERAGIFQVAWNIPPGFEVVHVQGRAVGNVPAVEIADWRVEGDAKDRLTINFRKRALGQVTVEALLRRDLPEAERLDRPAEPRTWNLALPRVAPETVDRSVGRLAIYAPNYLQIDTKPVAGLHVISLAENSVPAAIAERPAELSPVMAFAFSETASQLEVTAQRRRPQLHIAQLLVIRIEDRVVRYDGTFFGEVQFSGLKEVRIDVPESVTALLRNQSPQLRERRLSPQPEDVSAGFVAYGFSAATELLGEFTIRLTWEEPVLEDLEKGAGFRLGVPHLEPRGADRSWGQIVIVKSENIEVREAAEVSGLRPIDPQRELMHGQAIPEAAGAFEFTGDWNLVLEALRYRIEPTKQAAIERAFVRMVVTRSDRIAVQALYRVRSVQQRLAVALPPGAEPENEQRINGRRFDLEVAPEGNRSPKENQNRHHYYIPLTQTAPEEAVVLELRYHVTAHRPDLMLPEFSIDPDVQPIAPAVQRVYLAAYIPEEMRLLTKDGPWTEEFDWHFGRGGGVQPRFHQSADPQSLINWITEGTNVTVGDFAVDGTAWVYSSIAPPGGDQGALCLRICDARLWNGLLVLAGVLIGVLLIRFSWRKRLWILAWLVLVACIAAAFFPIAAAQAINRTSFLVGIGVVVVWLFAGVVRRRPGGESGDLPPAEDSSEPPPASSGHLTVPPLPSEKAPSQQKPTLSSDTASDRPLEDDDVIIERPKPEQVSDSRQSHRSSPETNASDHPAPWEGESRHDQE